MEAKTILLVDDSRTTLMMEQMLLKKEPYRVVTASNGADAIRIALDAPPDLILLDVVMPEVDGFAVCERLQSEPATESVPIIMVTTRGEAEHVERAFKTGCSDFITKPIDGLELLAKVRNHLAD